MMMVTKLFVLAFGLFTVSELGSQAAYGKSPACMLSKHLMSKPAMIRLHRLFHHLTDLVELSEDDKVEDEDSDAHQRAWGEERLKKKHFHEKMQKKMEEVKQCHKKCGWDRDCHMKCPKPWAKFQEMCSKMEPIFSCHKNCFATRGGKECHMQCPLAEKVMTCPKMAEKVKEARECHMKCEDRECHHTCPKPLKKVHQKCEALDEIMTCHHKCGMDGMCHHNCPKMEKLWHMDGGRDFHHKLKKAFLQNFKKGFMKSSI